MSDTFREQARALNALRREKEVARAALAQARDRSLRDHGDGDRAARQVFRDIAAREHTLIAVMADATDPQNAVNKLSDADPFLLLPVRIETRFKNIQPAIEPGRGSERASAAHHELWLRIYPDDCEIDSFEALPSDSEIAATQIYWRNMWRAGGDEQGAREAWRGLVSSCGVGRAEWLTRNYTPVNLADRPTRSPARETLLVASSDRAPTAEVLTALGAYWPAVWAADKDGAALAAARQALVAALGDDAAADAAIAAATPFNLSDARTDTAPPARFVIVVFPDAAAIATQRASWSTAPKTFVMPDRFVALGYDGAYAPGATPSFVAVGAPIPSPLILGLDPLAPRGEQLGFVDGGLQFGEDIAWLTDFNAAISAGMAMRIPITAAQAEAGFARIIVLGVRTTADGTEAAGLIETMLVHHRDCRSGLALLPQGAATNNTEDKPADLKFTEDADASYTAMFTPAGVPIATSVWGEQRDGARLAAALGLPLTVLAGVPGVNGADQIEARAMQVALWPGTLGYVLHDLGEAVAPEIIDFARAFMVDTVSGRGPIPAIRIGAQPYGILPTTAFSRLSFARRSDKNALLLDSLAGALKSAERDWAAMTSEAAWVGKGGDPHLLLLDILGHQPASVEFYRRTAESFEEHLNLVNLVTGGARNDLKDALANVFGVLEVPQLLARLGWITAKPTQRVFSETNHYLWGPVIDDRPLSESDTIRPYTSDGRNYLAWLADEALLNLDIVRRQSGFIDDTPPSALLYIVLRFALLSGYRHEATDRLLREGRIDATTASAYRRDPAFVHVKAEGSSESRWTQLYQSEGSILLHQAVAADLRAGVDGPLREQVAAIAALKDVPTARLERLFVEHVDCLSYRLDAWRSALAFQRLKEMRGGDAQTTAREGLLLGAYGWVENIRPRAPLTPFTPPQDLAPAFADARAEPLAIDPANQGFIHAPSLDHAVTAAILRSGHMSAADPASGQELSVNLTSERVRRALDIMQGMREGQSLSALLGYQFERGLHERHAPLELDRFIQPLRNVFPLDANRIPETADPPGASGTVAARNVVDGRALARRAESAGQYPFGLADLPDASGDETAAIADEVERLSDTLDAVSDVALAESVHQSARGNFDRAAGMLDAFARGGPPPEPEVTLTPRTGVALTHRVGVHFDPNAPDLPAATPRAAAEPRLERWLAQRLPSPASIACQVTYFDQQLNRVSDPVRISVADLRLSAIDLVAMTVRDANQAMGAFDERVVRHLQGLRPVCPDAPVSIDYTVPPDAATVSLFELAPLLASLRAILARSRPLRATDLAPPSEPYPDPAPRLELTPIRISARIQPLRDIGAAAATLASEAAASAQADRDGAPGARDALIAAIDDYAERLAARSIDAGLYGLPHAGFALVQDGRRAIFAGVRGKAFETAARWQMKLTDAVTRLAEDDQLRASGASDADRRTALRATEKLVSTRIALPDPPPAPDLLRAQVTAARDAFALKLAAIDKMAHTTATTLNDLITEARALLPLDAFENLSMSFAEDEARFAQFCENIALSAAALAKDATVRADRAQQSINAFNAAGFDADRARSLDDATKSLFGSEFFIVPGVVLSQAPRDNGASQAGDWDAAVAGKSALLRHLTVDLKRLDPVDEWLAGVARVRTPMHDLERIAILSEGFGAAAMKLDALQVPYTPGDSWLGAEFPPAIDLRRDRLLYAAHFSAPWTGAMPVYGILIDEWVETVPNEIETTGLAFHYDRPNAEPPQAMMLVVPPVRTGAWRWDDLVDAVNETLDLAKERAVEPAFIDKTAYARLLPALLFSMAQTEISIVADLAMNTFALKVKEGVQ